MNERLETGGGLIFGLFYRAFPISDADLFASCNIQSACRSVFGNGRAATNGATRTEPNRCDQNTIAADMYVGLNNRLVLVGAVVVGGNAAGAEIHALSYSCIPQVG